MSGIDDPINDRLGLPALAKINADANANDARSDAIVSAARRIAGLEDALRLALGLAKAGMGVAGVPLGVTAVDVVRGLLDAATEPRA